MPYIEPLLRKGITQGNTLLLILCLPSQAVILAHEDATERAVELLTEIWPKISYLSSRASSVIIAQTGFRMNISSN